MSTTFTKLLNDCLYALGEAVDSGNFPRATVVSVWAVESMQNFPILRPMLDDHTNGVSIVYSYELPADFREVITIEYPIGNQPPTYLVRKNRLDPDFHTSDGYYDIDHAYVYAGMDAELATGLGFVAYISKGIAASAHIKMQYLANHKTTLLDNSVELITVPDEYTHICIAYVVAKAFRQRLSKYMIDPTAHTSIIQQMTEMVKRAEDNYRDLAQRAVQRLSQSRITPNLASDKYDRVY